MNNIYAKNKVIIGTRRFKKQYTILLKAVMGLSKCNTVIQEVLEFRFR